MSQKKNLLVNEKPVYSLTLTVKVCLFIYLLKLLEQNFVTNCKLFYLTLDNNTKYGLTRVGLGRGHPDFRVRHPVVDRWTVNYNYIFRKYLVSSLNVLYTNCLFFLKVLCLYQLMLLRKAKI